MKDDNFLRANNAQHLWHPMGHPGDLRENAPTIIAGRMGHRSPISTGIARSTPWAVCGA